MSEQTKVTGGISFPMALGLVFITLKLAGIGVVASWSWWWVLSPIWIPFAILAGGVVVVFVVAVFAFIVSETVRAIRRKQAHHPVVHPSSSPLQ